MDLFYSFFFGGPPYPFDEKAYFIFLLINDFRNCIIEIVNVHALFGVKLI